jgi:hypothetical protein
MFYNIRPFIFEYMHDIISFNEFNTFVNEPTEISYSINHMPKLLTVYSRINTRFFFQFTCVYDMILI